MRSLGPIVFALALWGVASAQTVTAQISPQIPYAEPVRQGQAFNFDVLVKNNGATPAELTAIEVTYVDGRGEALLQREADNNGSNPAIQTIANRSIAPGEERMVFNPFPVVAAELPIEAVRVRLTFSIEGEEAPIEVETSSGVRRAHALVVALPLQGELLVWSAHDLMAHHRRFDYALAPLRAFGMVSNSGRYAYDFVLLDEAGRRVVGEENQATNWVGFNAPVLAPADGVVVEVRSDMPDNGEWNPEQLPEDPNVVFGNHVILEHASGVFLVLAHLRQGSVRVRMGDHVRQGQVLAAVGHSGSSLFPHLHFQVMTGRDGRSEGAPSTFRRFERIAGDVIVRVREGALETGDIVRSRR